MLTPKYETFCQDMACLTLADERFRMLVGLRSELRLLGFVPLPNLLNRSVVVSSIPKSKPKAGSYEPFIRSDYFVRLSMLDSSIVEDQYVSDLEVSWKKKDAKRWESK
jgi:hypothetical protein